MRFAFWPRAAVVPRSFELPDVISTESEEEEEFFDARSITGQSEATFYSARGGNGSFASFSAAGSVADADQAAETDLDDLAAFKADGEGLDNVNSGEHEAPEMDAVEMPAIKKPRSFSLVGTLSSIQQQVLEGPCRRKRHHISDLSRDS
jgi:hypothetical protein